MPVFHVIAAAGGVSAEYDIDAESVADAARQACAHLEVEATHLLVRRIGDDT